MEDCREILKRKANEMAFQASAGSDYRRAAQAAVRLEEISRTTLEVKLGLKIKASEYLQPSSES
jgi:hypothetical protein